MADVDILDRGRRTQLFASAGETIFTFRFLIFEATDIEVFLTKAGAIPNPVQDLLTIDVNYTVPIAGVNNEDGGTIVLVVPADINDVITLQSDTDQTQLVDFTVGGQFAPATINFVIDKLTILNQEVKSLIKDLGLSYSTVDQLDKSAAKGDNTLPVLPARTADIFPVWTKNENNVLIAGELKEESGCSTLRAELFDNGIFTDGAQIVGYFNPFKGIPPGIAETVDVALDTLFQTIAPFTFHVTGDLKPSFAVVAENGWIRMNDDTIGNPASGATAEASTEVKALFELLWNNIVDEFAPVSGGRGATATADFNANKTLRFPLINGRAAAGAGQGATLTNRVLGSVTGKEEVILSIAEMPSHTHVFQSGGQDTREGGSQPTATQSPTANTEATGGGAAHENMQPTTFMNWYIKL